MFLTQAMSCFPQEQDNQAGKQAKIWGLLHLSFRDLN